MISILSPSLHLRLCLSLFDKIPFPSWFRWFFSSTFIVCVRDGEMRDGWIQSHQPGADTFQPHGETMRIKSMCGLLESGKTSRFHFIIRAHEHARDSEHVTTETPLLYIEYTTNQPKRHGYAQPPDARCNPSHGPSAPIADAQTVGKLYSVDCAG